MLLTRVDMLFLDTIIFIFPFFYLVIKATFSSLWNGKKLRNTGHLHTHRLGMMYILIGTNKVIFPITLYMFII